VLFRPFTQRQADALHQPNTTETFHKHVFAFLHRKGVVYSFTNDFNGPGSFQAWWTNAYAEAQSFRSNIGCKPMQAAVDPNAEQKIRDHQHLYDPFNNHYDCLKLLIRQVIKYNALRGAGEVRLVCFLFYFI
jgi:hypothetical protein